MQLKDADALKENFKLPEESGRMGKLLEMVIHAAIDDAPIIEERKNGRWIDMGDFVQCSVCTSTHLKEVQTIYGKVTWIKTPYCPNCGAKMEVGYETD